MSQAVLDEANLSDADVVYDQKTRPGSIAGATIPAKSDLQQLVRERAGSVVDSRPTASDIRHWLDTTEISKPQSPVTFADPGEETYGRWVITRGIHSLDLLALPSKFRIAIYPVTNQLFLEFVQANGYGKKQLWGDTFNQAQERFLCQDGLTHGPSTWLSEAGYPSGRYNDPVAGISYYEALAFCHWLQEQKEYQQNGWEWCLPTEDMWELVARSEKGYPYPWGWNFELHLCNSVEEGIGTTTDVKRFPAGKSEKGACFDMAGNVWEFVTESEEHWYCVLRGGSFRNNKDELKSYLRLWGVPRDRRAPDFGFRCAQKPKTQEPQ